MSPQKRSCPETEATSSDDSSNNNKRQKRHEFNGDDLICAITTELPWDPVTAEDGRVYERLAIEFHFVTCQYNGEQIRSPVTNKPMGTQLLPAIQHRNLIESLIDSGVLSGSLVDKLKGRRNLEKRIKRNERIAKKALFKKARNGDAISMYLIGKKYFSGINGFVQDYKAAHEWFTKGHHAGNIHATCSMGYNLLKGLGVSKCSKQAYIYLALAAAKGEKLAELELGKMFADGTDGIPVNKKDAIYWLERSLDDGICGIVLGEELRDVAEQKLQELRQQQP